eukprot:TRINITY_DN19673_c0_g1_i1.p1 TRINITY_DN19673_c0_g1~~TRINITY_DN19673_c0_g1_i1.p1  ORF type:complete len:747 (-),score=189.20 TRINITY_DN19673_c0_g1_i1:344-2584(-)
MALRLDRLAAKIDRYAARTLLNTPEHDQALYSKWTEQHEAANEEGRKMWALGMWALMLTIISFWDWVIMILVLGIGPFAMLTRSGNPYKTVGWLVNPCLLAWLLLRMCVANTANPAARNQVADADSMRVFLSLLYVFTWNEVSGLPFSGLLCQHVIAHVIVHVRCGARVTCVSPLFSLLMFGLFSYRRYWSDAVIDQVSALIAREQLQQSQLETKFLRNLSETKSVFLRTLCHELRNPMTSVQGNTEILVQKLGRLLQRAQHHEPTPALMGEIVAELSKMLTFGNNAMLSSQHMSVVLNHTLTSAGLESQQGMLVSPSDRSVVDLQKSVGMVLQMFQVIADRKGIELDLVLPPGQDLMVQTNDSFLKQNLINLLGNALKFTEKGRIGVTVRVLHGAENILEVSVSDTGIGMTEEEQGHIFSAFSQANPQIKAQYGGSGLGLGIVRQSLKEMGGSIRVQSEKGHGSTFTFELPVGRGQDTELASPLATPFAGELTELMDPSGSHLRRRKKRVLIAEDDSLLRELLQEQLSDAMECEVSTAANGEEAVHQAGLEKFDLILMDVNMPVMCGLAATRAIREGSGSEYKINAHTPILGLSGNSSDGDVQLGMEAGMDCYLTKPYQFRELCEAIQEHTSPTPRPPWPSMRPRPRAHRAWGRAVLGAVSLIARATLRIQLRGRFWSWMTVRQSEGCWSTSWNSWLQRSVWCKPTTAARRWRSLRGSSSSSSSWTCTCLIWTAWPQPSTSRARR